MMVSCFSVLALCLIWIDKIWITRDITMGIPTVLGCIVYFSGVQLMILGIVGEYLGRLYLDSTGTPQFIVRYTTQPDGRAETTGSTIQPREAQKVERRIRISSYR